MSIISKLITVILATTIWIKPNIVTVKVYIRMICILVSVIVVVGVSMMVVAELMKTEFVPKLLTAVVVVVRVYTIYEDLNPNL